MTNRLLMTELPSNLGETLWMRCSLGVGLGLQQNRWPMLKRLGVRSLEAVAVQELQCGKKKHRREKNDCYSRLKRMVSFDMYFYVLGPLRHVMCFYSICIRYHNDFAPMLFLTIFLKGYRLSHRRVLIAGDLEFGANYLYPSGFHPQERMRTL